MVKVKCKCCGNIGYTACPKQQVCECGGEFKVIQEEEQVKDTNAPAGHRLKPRN